MGVFAVEGEGGLAVGAGLDELVAVAVREKLAEALGGDSAAAVLEGVGKDDTSGTEPCNFLS